MIELRRCCGILIQSYIKSITKGVFHACMGAVILWIKGVELYHIEWLIKFRRFYVRLNDYKCVFWWLCWFGVLEFELMWCLVVRVKCLWRYGFYVFWVLLSWDFWSVCGCIRMRICFLLWVTVCLFRIIWWRELCYCKTKLKMWVIFVLGEVTCYAWFVGFTL